MKDVKAQELKNLAESQRLYKEKFGRDADPVYRDNVEWLNKEIGVINPNPAINTREPMAGTTKQVFNTEK